jgi:hypothetical protein
MAEVAPKPSAALRRRGSAAIALVVAGKLDPVDALAAVLWPGPELEAMEVEAPATPNTSGGAAAMASRPRRDPIVTAPV